MQQTLLTLALSILAGAGLALFTGMTRFWYRIKVRGRHPFRRKPFTCPPCLGAWSSAFFAAFATYVDPCIALIACALFWAGITTALLYRHGIR